MPQSWLTLRAYVLLEASILAEVWTGMRAPFLPMRPSGLTYSTDSLLGVLGMILLVGALPEVLLHHLLLGNSMLALGLDAVVLYAAAWCFGIYGAVVERPHRISGDCITLNNGPFASLAIPTDAIASVKPRVPAPARRERRNMAATASFLLGAKKAVEIEFALPVEIRLLPYLPSRRIVRILVASDRPDDLCARLSPLLKG
ncbi:MAG: hypothetical protein NVSMB31_19670 [Vulcanimicrobiaceae bacterium]